MQIGDENVHLVRCVMDEVFGSENFCQLRSRFKNDGGSDDDCSPASATTSSGMRKDASSVKYRQLFIAKELGDDGDEHTTALSCQMERRGA